MPLTPRMSGGKISTRPMETQARPMTADEYTQGHVPCDCGEYTYIFRQCVMQRLPRGYSGELCQLCGLWMCKIDKLALKTAKEREEAFRHDLAEMLEKHKAELDITDDGKSYGMHSGIAVVKMMSEWDEDGNQITEYTEFRI